MGLYDNVYKIFETETIAEFCDSMNQFIEKTLPDKRRKAIVEEFYSYFLQLAVGSYAFSDNICSWDIENRLTKKYAENAEKLNSFGIFMDRHALKSNKYYVCDGKEAFWLVLYYHLPPCTSPVKTLKALKEYTKEIRETYSEKEGPIINVESVLEILSYVDQKYDFFNIVHNDYRPVFAIADIAHNEFNSLCQTIKHEDGLVRTFVYLTRKGNSTNCSPEAILFHEIGHMLHTRCFDLIPGSKDMVISILNKTCFPGITDMDEGEQNEIIADVISMGFMYDSPYEEYDPFEPIALNDKYMFSKIVQKMIDLMEIAQKEIQEDPDSQIPDKNEYDYKKGA